MSNAILFLALGVGITAPLLLMGKWPNAAASVWVASVATIVILAICHVEMPA